MRGKNKIEELTTEWYGFQVVSCLVHAVMAFFGSGLFAVFTVPLVLVFGVVGLLITWAIGALLIRKSQLTRIILLVLSPIAIVLSGVGLYQLVVGPWSLGMIITGLLGLGALYMYVNSFLTLMHKDVRAYFG